jgi:Flp pilus assembly protein TadG
MLIQSQRKRRRGQVALLATMLLVVMLGVLSLTVDFGWAYFRKEAARAAAESGAMAAAIAASENASFDCTAASASCQSTTNCPANPIKPAVTNLDGACLYAKQNGFRTAGNQTVTVAANRVNSPVSGVSPNYWVSTTVTERIPQLFSRAVGQPWATVAVRSTAGIFLRAAGACIFALATTGTGLSVNGTMDIESGCGIYVNSTNASNAMTAGGNSRTTASVINIVGGYNTNGGAYISPLPSTGRPPTPDPLASRNGPDAALISSLPCSPAITANSSITMPGSGYYKVCSGGFTMTGNKNLTIPGGTYVFTGGDMDLRNGTLRATGPVTFYMTGSFSSVQINGNVDIELAAPTTGPYRGLLFFQDRNITLSSIRFNGGSSMVLSGSLYFPTSDMDFSGGNTTENSFTALVAQHIKFVGNSYLKADLNGTYNGLNNPLTALLE